MEYDTFSKNYNLHQPQMPFLDHVLQVPTYGWKDADGNLVKPSKKEIFTEFFKRLNIFKDKRNWLPFFSWLKVAASSPFVSSFWFTISVGGLC